MLITKASLNPLLTKLSAHVRDRIILARTNFNSMLPARVSIRVWGAGSASD